MLYSWADPAVIAECDRERRELDAELGGLSYRIGHAVAPFLRRGHDRLGYSRFAPFAQDMLGVSGRTLQRWPAGWTRLRCCAWPSKPGDCTRATATC